MHLSISAKRQTDRTLALQEEIERLQKELGQGRDPEEIVKHHIKLLHEYNEAKDATQILIGRLAALRETTIRQIHEDYGLTNAD